MSSTAERRTPAGVGLVRISVEIPASVKGALEAVAVATGSTLSQQVRAALLAHLDSLSRLVRAGERQLSVDGARSDVLGADGRLIVAGVDRDQALALAGALAATTGEHFTVIEVPNEGDRQ